MEAPQIQEHLEPLVASTHEQLLVLQKYESTLSPENKAALKKTLADVDKCLASVRAWVPHSGTSAFLSTGSQKELSDVASMLQQHLGSLLGGGFPLPRSSKEELSSLKEKLSEIRPHVCVAEDRAKVEAKLLELYTCGVEKRMDPDAIESQVDQLIKEVLLELYGESQLDQEDLQRELDWLVEAVDKFGSRGHWVVYSMALNSLERLHGVHAKPEEEGTEVTEEVEAEAETQSDNEAEDPFFMPIPISALKMADSKKFAVLAEPLGQPSDAQARPVLDLKDDSSKQSNSEAPPPVPVLGPEDFEQVPSNAQMQEQQASKANPPAAQPPLDKHAQLAKFLQGESQGACTFHAQMRLSREGCYKLAKFLETSGRIKALSLSANYLGDESITVICRGLKVNKTVASIDFPNNDITDEGAIALAEAIAGNQIITQLELGNNQIGDRGAMAIAKVLKSNIALKKIGFANNKIGREGCLALAEAARANACIKQVQVLPGNPIQERDARTLAKAIQTNKKHFSIRSLFNFPAKFNPEDWGRLGQLGRNMPTRKPDSEGSQRSQGEQQAGSTGASQAK